MQLHRHKIVERDQKVGERQGFGQSTELSCVLRCSNTFHVFCFAQILDRSRTVKPCHTSTISYFRPSILIPSIFNRHPPIWLFRVVSETHNFSLLLVGGNICAIMDRVDVISASTEEDVCCYYMPPCNLKRLHYQFPQCKLDRVVNAFSLQLLIISGAMGGWIRGQDKSSLSSTFHKITV